jgi:hypothetical protein
VLLIFVIPHCISLDFLLYDAYAMTEGFSPRPGTANAGCDHSSVPAAADLTNKNSPPSKLEL